LTAEGHAVDVVADGYEAQAWAASYPYDLVLLDVVLPGDAAGRRLPVQPPGPIVATVGCIAVALAGALVIADRGIAGLDVVGALRER